MACDLSPKDVDGVSLQPKCKVLLLLILDGPMFAHAQYPTLSFDHHEINTPSSTLAQYVYGSLHSTKLKGLILYIKFHRLLRSSLAITKPSGTILIIIMMAISRLMSVASMTFRLRFNVRRTCLIKYFDARGMRTYGIQVFLVLGVFEINHDRLDTSTRNVRNSPSFFCFPLHVGEGAIGFLGSDTPKSDRSHRIGPFRL
ncbi:hypothetical protein SISSUDRAFT_197927 [Sistotremastrum suecicum HHB10207 ss-3]|uniref:Uncharacterized protein n=1 Tax=Sistotremastrum suecicum HHB10207 ss-3 TaxID=1314776 RepID=A0A166AB14_9AGAM|nr:hypothetical protein SISSUDRAFT_197927 [Sistotremastrum suecicum HHB10207 ss-3]